MRPSLDNLQAGRACAAIAVAAHHADQASRGFLRGGYNLLEFGYIGVDFFFVLSGFIIMWSCSRLTSSAGWMEKQRTLFFKKRLIRIFIPYLPIGVLFAVLYSTLPNVSASGREWSWLPTLTLLPWQLPPALSVAWTLQHELVFYLLFGFLFFSGRLWIGVLLWAFLISAVNIFFSSWEEAASLPRPLGPIFSLINLEFCFGLVAAHLVISERRFHPAALLVIALFCFSAWLGLSAKRELSVLFGLSLAFTMLALVQAELKGQITVPKWISFLGDASYSIYLIHPLVIAIAARALAGADALKSPALAITIMVSASIFAGVIYHLIIEKPALSLVRSLLASKTEKPLPVVPDLRTPQ